MCDKCKGTHVRYHLSTCLLDVAHLLERFHVSFTWCWFWRRLTAMTSHETLWLTCTCAESALLLIKHSLKVKNFRLWIVCLFVLRLNVPVNNFSVMSGRSHRFLGNLPVLSGSKVSCSRTQHGSGKFGTPDLSLLSPTLYHWATALPQVLNRHKNL